MQKRTHKILLVGWLLMLPIYGFACCNKSTVVNAMYSYQANPPAVVATWQAWGCFGVEFGHPRVCEDAYLRHYRDHATFEYPVGTSGDIIHFSVLLPNGKYVSALNQKTTDPHSCAVHSPNGGTVRLMDIYTTKKDGTKQRNLSSIDPSGELHCTVQVDLHTKAALHSSKMHGFAAGGLKKMQPIIK